MKYLVAVAIGYLIADHMKVKREMARWERLILTGAFRKEWSRNNRTPVWSKVSHDTAYEHIYQGMTQ